MNEFPELLTVFAFLFVVIALLAAIANCMIKFKDALLLQESYREHWEEERHKNYELQGKFNILLREYETLKVSHAELQETKPKEVRTIDASQILHDLTHGTSVIKITPLDPADIFWRRPT